MKPHDDGDESLEEPNEDDGSEERIQLTPEQTERLRRADLQRSLAPQIKLPKFTLPTSAVEDVVKLSGIVEGQQALFAAAFKPMLDSLAAWQEQINASITSDFAKLVAPALADVGRMTERLAKGIDFSGIAPSLDVIAKINATFAEQQHGLINSLGPALKALRAGFYPPNLRAIENIKFEDVNTVAMIDGIPLYGVPRATTAEALIRARCASKRREILGRRWKTISADCRELVLGCDSHSIAPYAPFAVAALDALDAGHTAAAQALSGSLVDTIVTGYFGNDRYRYTPNKKSTTAEAYEKFTIREYVAFAPIWQTYQQFFITNGDKVPTRFNRHATAHAVSARQYSKRNAVQAVMLVCSLLYRLDEEAATLAGL